MEFKEEDLVLVRMQNNGKREKHVHKYNVWIRIKYIDTGYAVGIVERTDQSSDGRINFTFVAVGIHAHKEGESFCYWDNVTVCSCPGLCRNK